MRGLKRTSEGYVGVQSVDSEFVDEQLGEVVSTSVFDASGGGKPHYHIVFCDDESGVVLCSPASDGHTHEIQYVPAQPPQPPQVDPMSGQPIPGTERPATPKRYIVLPAADGHTHDALEEYTDFQQAKKEGEEKVVADVLTLFTEAVRISSDSRKVGLDAEEFVWGKQWDEGLEQLLEQEGRSHLTINKTGKYVNQLCGHQRMNRTSIHFLPTEDGDQAVADVLNVALMHDLDRCDFAREESAAFKEAVISGVGWFNVKMDFTKNLQGEWVVERLPWTSVVAGPHEKPDLSDCEYIVKHRLFSEAKLRQMWGEDVTEKITARSQDKGLDALDPVRESEPHNQYPDNQYARSDNVYPAVVGDITMVDIARKEYRVLECWRRVYRKVFVAANAELEYYQPLHGWKRKDAEAVRFIPGFTLIEADMPEMRVSQVCGGYLLSDENPADVPGGMFNVVPIYGERIGDRFKGVVRDAMDPQREYNKRRSQMIDIGNRMVSYSYFITPETFVDESELARFKRESAVPGSVFILNPGQEAPTASQGVKFPNELAALNAVADSDLREMIDVAVEPAGSREPAASLAQRQRMSLMGKEEYFDNLSFAKKLIGRLYVHYVQKYYTPERLLRILGSRAMREEVEVAGQPYDPVMHREQLLNILKEKNLSAYDVSIGESAFSPTAKMQTSATIQEIAARGGPIPPQMLIESLDVPEAQKRKLMKMLEASQAQQADAASNTRNMEIEKTLIGQGIIPPKVADEFGVSGQIPGGQQGVAQAPQPVPQPMI